MTDTSSPFPASATAAPKTGFRRVLGTALNFVRVQGTQASTWRGLAMIISACGIYIRPDLMAAITAVGMAASGLIGVLTNDSPKPAE